MKHKTNGLKGLTFTQHSKAQLHILLWCGKLCQSIPHLSGPGSKLLHCDNPAAIHDANRPLLAQSAQHCAAQTLRGTYPHTFSLRMTYQPKCNPNTAGNAGRNEGGRAEGCSDYESSQHGRLGADLPSAAISDSWENSGVFVQKWIWIALPGGRQWEFFVRQMGVAASSTGSLYQQACSSPQL